MACYKKDGVIKAILNFCVENDIRSRDIVLVMGAALVMHGIRETCSDIDVSCPKHVFVSLIKQGYSLSKTESKLRKICVGDISIYENWRYTKKQSICDIWVCDIEDVVEAKSQLMRIKDLEDIVSISEKKKPTDHLEYYQVCSYPNILRGMLHRGHGDEIVLLVSGYFSANRIGVNGLFYHLAKHINTVGMPVLRVDLSCMGESDGDFEKLKFKNHVIDLYTIIHDLKKKGYRKIHLVGHCEGCFTAVKMLEFYECIESLILISPVLSQEKTFVKFIGEEGVTQLSQNGYVYRKGLKCDKSFFDLDNLLLRNRYLRMGDNRRICVIVAEKEEYSDNESVLNWAKANGFDFFTIPDANHNYTDPSAKKKLYDLILRRVVDGCDR